MLYSHGQRESGGKDLFMFPNECNDMQTYFKRLKAWRGSNE